MSRERRTAALNALLFKKSPISAGTPNASPGSSGAEPVFDVEPLERRDLLSAFTAHINFQPKKSPTPKGYIADVGYVLKKRSNLTFGWSSQNTSGLFDRNSKLSPDQRYDTGNLFANTRAKWELVVPNGTYQVHIVGGDPTDKGNVIKIKAEGKLVASGTTTKSKHWVEGTLVVKVTDGKLTLAGASGAVRNKIDFIDVVGFTPATNTISALGNDGLSGAANDKANSAVTSIDSGDWIKFSNIDFGKGGLQSVFATMDVSTATGGQFLDFHIDLPDGPTIASLKTQPTGLDSLFVTQHAAVTTNVTGVHDIYVSGRGNGALTTDIADLRSFKFSSQKLIKVMVLGDSIIEGRSTQVVTPDANYSSDIGSVTARRTLFHMLESNGYAVDFVGSHTGVRKSPVDTVWGDPKYWDFDMDNEGHSGYRTDQILNGVPTIEGGAKLDNWVTANVPDVVLIELGINDLRIGTATATVVANMATIIDHIRAANPNVQIVLSEATPVDPVRFVSAETLVDYNAKLLAMAQAKTTPESPIAFELMYHGFEDYHTKTFDGLHPTEAAENEQAARWYDGMLHLPLFQ